MIAAVNAVYDNPRHLLLDEIQNLPRWELFVNRLQRQGLRLILTGSNAHLLSSELATHLTGRHLPIILFPFSFAEALRTHPGARTGPEMAEQFRRYSEAGGYPEPLLRDMDREYYLRTLWNSVLYKDIVRRRRIRSVAGLDDLAGYLLANVAREYSLNRLTAVTRCRSVHTVAKYIGHLEEAFLFFSLPRFSSKVGSGRSPTSTWSTTTPRGTRSPCPRAGRPRATGTTASPGIAPASTTRRTVPTTSSGSCSRASTTSPTCG